MRRGDVPCIAILAAAIAAGAAGQEMPDQDWPRVFVEDGNAIIVHQPQIDRWDDFENITAIAAVSVKLAGEEQTEYGSVRWMARTVVDHESRDVLFGSRSFAGMMFSDTSPERYPRIRETVESVLPNKEPLVMSLDEIVAYLDTGMFETPEIEVNLDPPPIYYSDRPAILAIFFGEPRFEPITGSNLLFAVNTNWDIFLELASSDYYLLYDEGWLTTKDVMNGPWSPARFLPEALGTLPEGDNWDYVRRHFPGNPLEAAPLIFTSQAPAELIVTDAAPNLAPIPGTSLLSVTNTDSDLFLHSKEEQYYLLTAGRWFRAASLEGPWSAATTDLPDDFRRIPADHAYAHVLSSVPGTSDAQVAVLLASVPKKATIYRNEVSVDVFYVGNPQFQAIAGTAVSFATNTPYDVFLVDGAYYCCYQGIWFESASPIGPWAACVSVPEEIYTIPSTSPKHNVTYVEVYESTPETVVVGQTAGYTGEYVALGLLMFGLGYAIAEGDAYVHIQSRSGFYNYPQHYYSYGCSARYDYYRGSYYRAAAAYGPYGGAGRWAAYNPASGTYSRGAARYGPRGGAYAREAYNPYTNRYAGRVTASSPYGSWGRSVISDGDNWARAGHRSGPRGTIGAAETSEGGQIVAGRGRYGDRGFVGRSAEGDVYAGRNGKVYRRDEDGQWQQRRAGDWSDIGSGRGRAQSGRDADLDRLRKDAQARQRGSQRASTYQKSRNSSRGARQPARSGSRGGGSRGRR